MVRCRVRAAVALAPGVWYSFGEEGLRDVIEPLVLGGDQDGDLPYESEIRGIYDHLGPSRALLTIHGAGHWGFSDLCETLGLDVFDDCAGEAGGFIDPAETAAITVEAATAHLQVHLRGETRAASSLGAARWDADPAATWEQGSP